MLLTGAEEVPPRATNASGQLTLQLSKDGQSMDYILDIENISNVTQAHIHVAPKGSNGGIAIWLYPSVKSRTALPGGGGPVSRLLIEGTFTAADFVTTGPLGGKTMADFVALVNAAGAYGNVHTNDGVGDPNTGPGDFPGGEIRGQLDGHSKH
ncbi:MAG TPA: CHRD domain-containing protein [Gemmatimonadaceae bacterium]|nr:CHRD domain-containing protein [Gemmatimonadaceae bacterium]